MRLYDEIVLGDSPGVYWPLAADLRDLAGSAHLTLGGGSTTHYVGVGPGRRGGVNGSVGWWYTAGFRAPQAAYTVEAWLNPWQLGGAGDDVLTADWGGASATGVMVWIAADGSLNAAHGSTYLAVPIGTHGLVLNWWNHVVVTWDGTTRRMWVNGRQVGQDAPVGAPGQASTQMRVASYGTQDGGALPNSGLASVAWYSSALSEAKIKAHHTAGGGVGAYDALVLRDGPKLYLPLDDPAGATGAAGMAGQRATVGGAPVFGGAGPTPIGASMTLDGVDDHLSLTTRPVDGNLPSTYETWIYSASPITATSGAKMIYAAHGSAFRALGVGGDFTGSLANEVIAIATDDNATAYRTGWSGFSIPAGWHHLALTFTGAQNGWTAYLDGADVTAAPWGGTKIVNAGGAFGFYEGVNPGAYIGRAINTYSSITIAGFAVYDYMLSPSRIAAHAAASPPGFRSIGEAHASQLGAIVNLPLDEPGGSRSMAHVRRQGRAEFPVAGGAGRRIAGPGLGVPWGVSLDGSNDYIEIPAYTFPFAGGTSRQTIELWFSSATEINASSGFKRLLSVTNGGEYTDISFGELSNSYVNDVVSITSGTTTATIWTGFTIPAGWHHLVATYAGAQNAWELYLDGKNVTGATWGGAKAIGAGAGAWEMFNFAKAYAIGARLASSQYSAFAGVAGFAVYDRPLTAAEVWERYKVGLEGASPSRLAQAAVRY